MRYKFGVKCDLCRGKTNKPCERHNVKACSNGDCVHILDLKTLKKPLYQCNNNLAALHVSKLHESTWVKATGKNFFVCIFVCYLTNIYIFPRVCTVIDNTWRRSEQKIRDEVEWRECCCLYAVTSSVIYYCTHMRTNVIYLIYTKKMKLFEGGAWKMKNKSADVICACPLIDHGQQPMKIHTEVTLFYKLNSYKKLWRKT